MPYFNAYFPDPRRAPWLGRWTGRSDAGEGARPPLRLSPYYASLDKSTPIPALRVTFDTRADRPRHGHRVRVHVSVAVHPRAAPRAMIDDDLVRAPSQHRTGPAERRERLHKDPRPEK